MPSKKKKTKVISEPKEKAPLPEASASAMAKEVKDYINENYKNYIDYSYSTIEMWPAAADDSLAEMHKFAAQWEAFFAFADRVTGAKGKGFPHKEVKMYEEITSQVATLVNEDKEFWTELRAKVIPLYSPPGAADQISEEAKKRQKYWNSRWQSIKFWYDPLAMEVKTSKLQRVVDADGNPGEIRSREVISQRVIPPGFVIHVQ